MNKNIELLEKLLGLQLSDFTLSVAGDYTLDGRLLYEEVIIWFDRTFIPAYWVSFVDEVLEPEGLSVCMNGKNLHLVAAKVDFERLKKRGLPK